MSGQNTLVVIAEDAQIKRPSHKWNWQVYRTTAVPGAGVYKAMDNLGNIEIIGGPGAGSGIPFGNDTNILPNVIQVAIPGATLTDGYTFEVNILTTNTGATTLQTNALGIKDVVDSDGNPLVGNELINESIYLFVYDLQNDRYQLLGLAKPGPEEIWERGTGLQSAQIINTLFPNDASGDYSVAEGSNSEASAENAHAEGGSTEASGMRSHAEGSNTIASGTAAHAEGETTQAIADNSHAEGANTLASSNQAHAEGNNTVAGGFNSHAEGLNTAASGPNSHAEGEATIALGSNSHAQGNTTEANGDNSHAQGILTNANGTNSHAQGNDTTAGGNNSHAQGELTQAIGNNSHAQGSGTQALGLQSHAQGINTIALGENSHAQGNTTQANAENSHAQGSGTQAEGVNSHAGGLLSRASGLAAFNHSQATALLNSDAAGAASAIIGGTDNNVDVNSDNSVALGGIGNNVVGEPNTAQAQNFRCTDDFRITQGLNKNAGIATLVDGTVTVPHNNVKAGAVILVCHNTIAGIEGLLTAPSGGIVPNTEFVISSQSPDDDSTVNYLVINP